MSSTDSTNNKGNANNDNGERTIRDGIEVNQGQTLKISKPTIIESQFSKQKDQDTSETQTNNKTDNSDND